MQVRGFILLLAAFGLAGATGLGIKTWLDGQRAQLMSQARTPAPKPEKRVLVADRDIPTGSFVRPEALRWQAWPEAALSKAYLVEGERRLEDVVGALARQPLVAGEPLTEAKVVAPGHSGFLAAVLQPGLRAVTVPVTATSGIAGFIFPGDRVDLILTHTVPQDGEERTERRASETVLRDIRILAIDQKVEGKAGETIQARTATLEVTPKQGESVALVQDMGRLSLSLRSLAREGEPDAPARTSTVDSEVSRLLPPLRLVGSTREVSVLRGGKREQTAQVPNMIPNPAAAVR